MAWVDDHAASDSSFLILRPAVPWQINREAEWFPALARRRSILAVQGSERLPNHRFDQLILMDKAIQNFTQTWSNLPELERTMASLGERYTQSYLSHTDPNSDLALQLANSPE